MLTLCKVTQIILLVPQTMSSDALDQSTVLVFAESCSFMFEPFIDYQ